MEPYISLYNIDENRTALGRSDDKLTNLIRLKDPTLTQTTTQFYYRAYSEIINIQLIYHHEQVHR